MPHQEALIQYAFFAKVGWVTGGANSAAAKLGLERTTLIKRMQKLGISRPPRPNVNVDNAATSGSEWMPGIYKLHERFPFRFSPTLSREEHRDVGRPIATQDPKIGGRREAPGVERRFPCY